MRDIMAAPKANTAIRYRIYPDVEQKILIGKTIGCCRLLWNNMLSYNKRLYPFFGSFVLPKVTYYHNEYPFLKEVDSLALANTRQNLQQAFRNHFNNPDHFGLPRFKARSKTDSYSTNSQNNSIRIENSQIRLPKLGFVKMCYHKTLPADAIIKAATIERTKTGKYYVAVKYYDPNIDHLAAEFGIKPNNKVLIATGLDYSSPNLFCNDLGQIPEQMRWFRENEDKLAKLQRKMAKCTKKDSCKYKKYQRRYNRLHERIKNRRLDFYRKMALAFARCYDIVCVESLNMQQMGKRRNKKKWLGKATYDNAWGMFLRLLSEKLRQYGGALVRVGKWFASSKLCHHCGAKNTELTLSDREWVCPECGAVLSRDMNAALNILEEGVRLLRVASTSGESDDNNDNVDSVGRFLLDDQLVIRADGTSVPGHAPEDYACENNSSGDVIVVPLEGCNTWSLNQAKGCPVESGIKEVCLNALEKGYKLIEEQQATEAPTSNDTVVKSG